MINYSCIVMCCSLTVIIHSFMHVSVHYIGKGVVCNNKYMAVCFEYHPLHHFIKLLKLNWIDIYDSHTNKDNK